jgi:hypothetical protein
METERAIALCPQPLFLRFDTLPFAVAYAALLAYYVALPQSNESVYDETGGERKGDEEEQSFPLLMLTFGAVVVTQLLLFIAPTWSLSIKRRLRFRTAAPVRQTDRQTDRQTERLYVCGCVCVCFLCVYE